VSAAKPVLAVLAATDDHLQALQHYGHSRDLRLAMDTVGKMLDALQHLVRWHDQLTPSDIQRAKAVIAEATGSAS
jgi:hypothetical protein